MKLACPAAHGVRRRLGALCNKNRTSRQLGSLFSLLSPHVSFNQNPPRTKRHNSNATAPLTESDTKPKTTTIANGSWTSISDQVRLLMRRVPYPVAIITAADPSEPPESSFRGMTVSSFSTVTLTPHPVISFNVRRPSETLNALLASRRFLVHLLASGPETAMLARDFSKGNNNLSAMLSGHGEFEFTALYSGKEERPLPMLRRRGSSESSSCDIPFVLECTLHSEKIDVHDHSIMLGTVVRAIEGGESLTQESRVGEHSPNRLCLTYANTKFWKMGEEI